MRAPWFILFSLGLACFSLCAETGTVERPVFMVPHAVEVPRVSAEADDPAWRGHQSGIKLELIGNPSGLGGEDAFATYAEVSWDKQFLYVRFWCRSPEAPWAPFGDLRDAAHHEGDVVEVFIDPVGDARQFVEVQVSPAGGVFDKLYLLTAPPRSNASGVLDADLLRSDQWEIPEWNWDGLRAAAAPWKENGQSLGWIADLALPAKPLLRRLKLKDYAPVTMRAHLVRIARPVNNTVPSGRAFISFSWTSVPAGRPHRTPSLMGELHLVP